MKTLSDAATAQATVQRIELLQPDSGRRWGKMSPHQMLCHLADSFELALGEKHAGSITGLFQRTVMKWGGLYVPLPWPPGMPTRPELAQGKGGTRPIDFDLDRARLLRKMEKFRVEGATAPHPLFGTMSEWEWMRWGYLHADHHLRQFGL